MSKKHLSRNPHSARRSDPGERTKSHPNVWWYDEATYISIHIDAIRENGSVSARIPTHELRAYLARLDREDAPPASQNHAPLGR